METPILNEPNSSYNTNAIQQLLADIQRLHKNALAYAEVCQQAITNTDDIIDVTVNNADGSTTTVQVPSFANIQRRLAIIEHNVTSIVGMQNGKDLYAQLLEANNEVRTLVHMSLLNTTEPIASLKSTVAADNNVVQLGNDLLERATTLGMHLQVDVTGKVSAYMTKCQVTKYLMSDGMFAKFQSIEASLGIELTHAGFLAELQSNGFVEGTDYDVEDFTQTLRARRPMSNGAFNILFRKLNSDSSMSVKLDTMQYSSTNANVAGSLTLKTGDTLSTPTGDVLFTITAIDVLSNTCVLQRKAGLNNIAADISKLVYCDDVVQKVVDVPIKHSEKFAVFLSPVHDAYNTISAYSPTLLVDVSKLTIRNKDNELINANSYMLAYGDANIGAYIQAIATDMQPPAKYAVKPDKPQLNVNEYKVIQLNTHLTDNVDKTRILQLYEQKRSLQQELSALDSDISKLKQQLSTQNYKNDSERKNIQEQWVAASKDRAQKAQTLSNIVDQMLDVNSQAYDALYDPKFRIRGFLPVQDPSVSRYTSPQHIVQFKVQYRYVSLNGTVAKADTFDIEQDGKTTTAAFSTWNEVFTPLRRKIINDGMTMWEPVNADSIDAISCNQLDIPINPNETVQIRVKAIGEAGYPNILNESDWSNIMSVTFPESLAPNAQFVSLKDELMIDKQNIMLENMLDNKGVTEHISTAMTENNTYFAHKAQNLASGFYTQELANVSVYEKMLEMSNTIKQLQDIIINQGSMLRISLLDEEGNETEVLNGSTTTLYAGAYCDKFDMSNRDNYGSILSKQYYVKFTNIGTQAISIYPKYHGALNEAIDNIKADNIWNAPIAPLSSSYQGTNVDSKDAFWTAPLGSRQLKGQILYVGTKNVAGTQDLYSTLTSAIIPSIFKKSDIDESAQEDKKIWVQPTNDGAYISVALKSGAESKYICVSSKHPDYIAYLAATDKTATKKKLDELFKSLQSQYNLIAKGEQQQGLPDGDLTIDNAPKVLFDTNDKYLSGQNTRGAFLTIAPLNQSSIQVANSSSAANVAVEPGSAKSILVPLLFQARMTDYSGGIDMNVSLDSAQFQYSKTVNLHTYIGGKEFVFDVKIYADFRATSSIIGVVSTTSMKSMLG